MKTEGEIRAKLLDVEDRLAAGRLTRTVVVSLYSQADTLRWVLGMDPMMGEQDDDA